MGRFCTAVRQALAATVADPPTVALRPDHHLQDDLGLDSFAMLTFVGELELRLGHAVPASAEEPTLANLHRLVGGVGAAP